MEMAARVEQVRFSKTAQFEVGGNDLTDTLLQGWFRLVTRDSVKADFMAGLTGAVIVLPQGVAFATIAGLPPEYGLYTAMVTPIVAALFGSSFHLVSGPTTAISIVVFSAISTHAAPGTPEFVSQALTLTFLAGAYQLAFGLARLGTVVNFVSHTVVIGFTAGAALLIATSQMKHVLGIAIPKGESFLHTWVDVYAMADQVSTTTLVIALSTLVSAILVRKFLPQPRSAAPPPASIWSARYRPTCPRCRCPTCRSPRSRCSPRRPSRSRCSA